MGHGETITQRSGTRYFVPSSSYWPVVGCGGLFLFFFGAAHWLHDVWYGPYLLSVGLLTILLMLFGWFARVIHENHSGLYTADNDRVFRWGMAWFIFSEVIFFSAFFVALFYVRLYVVPMLGGETRPVTHITLWPDFVAQWPLLSNPDNVEYLGAQSLASPWAIPALNTVLLLSSGVTITLAHWGLRRQWRWVLIVGLILTVALGATFLYLQANEYREAYEAHGLTLNSGVYGSLFFLLTGFHGAHVTIGTTMLVIILIRSMLGHFTPDNHFAFQGVAWYWHFVDVVWLALFVFVYWL